MLVAAAALTAAAVPCWWLPAVSRAACGVAVAVPCPWLAGAVVRLLAASLLSVRVTAAG